MRVAGCEELKSARADESGGMRVNEEQNSRCRIRVSGMRTT
ncbi:hypothetical protein VCHA43P273_350008 [Vibrio chagasii]|nr:hypothetical protein VCHA43P273_350008 [Vibrio chagasii]